MALIPFSPEHLRVQDALPFGVRGASGALLLASGAVIDSAERLMQLRSMRLFVDERESEAWRRSLAGTVDAMVRRNVTLERIARARPEPARAAAARDDDSPLVQWEQVRLVAERLLAEVGTDGAWAQRARALAARARALNARSPNAALYLLVQAAQHEVECYSRHHAVLCMVVCDLVAATLAMGDDEATALVHAALTMNVSVTALQDGLALQSTPLTPAQRLAIDGHAEASVRLLRQAGVDDERWLECVRLHHDADAQAPLATLPAAQRLARVLRRVDIFTAKLSRRRARAGMTPTQAARDACLGADGVPDDVGAAMLKSLGLYPPGTYVRLASGEVGVVIGRGRRADLPLVGCVVNAAGAPLGEPVLRDTVERRHAVDAALRCDAVKVRLQHERMLRLAATRRP